jgi:hypothetical protein
MKVSLKSHHDEEYSMPSAEALLAGTLALMTGHVQATNEEHQQLMACKIVSNFSALAVTPSLSPEFKKMLCSLGERWQKLGGAVALLNVAGVECRMWHPTSAVLQ